MGVLGPQGCVTRGAQYFGVHKTLGCSTQGVHVLECMAHWGAQGFGVLNPRVAQGFGVHNALRVLSALGCTARWGAQRFGVLSPRGACLGVHNALGRTMFWGAQHAGVLSVLGRMARCGVGCKPLGGTPALGCTAFRGAPHLKAQLFGVQCTLGGCTALWGGCTTFWGARCLGLWHILGCT